MKKGLLLLVSVIFSLSVNAQVVVLFEDFEAPSLANLVTSTTGAGGAPHWAISDRLATSGMNSDTAKVPSASTAYLTSNFFNTIGNTYVLLEFNHICKIGFFDVAEIQVTGDSGQTWTTLTGTQYLGAGSFAALGNKFGPSSYNLLWEPGNGAAIPTNAWFRSEQFNISSICGSKTHAAVRFKLSDGGTLNNSEYGWIVDDIRVTAALSELTPPTITSFTPNPTGNLFSTGPFNFTAQVSDASGVMSVYMPYSINGNKDTVYFTNTTGTTYVGSIPAVTHLDVVCYKLVAVDNSLSHNVAYLPDSVNFYCFTASTEEAALLGIVTPGTGCGLNLEPVTIRIKNTGLTTIAGDLWAKYWIAGTTDTVTEYITDTIILNQILNYTFDSLVNVSAPAGDITYSLQTKIVLLGDPVSNNNAQGKNFISGLIPPKAPVMYDTINYATNTTLTTTIPGATIKWFADSLGTQLLYTGNSYTTPILFKDTVYYRNGTSGVLNCFSEPSPYFVEVGDKPPYDAAVIAMITPVSAINMIAQEKVKIKIKNFGGDTIWNFPVLYSINGGAPISETIQDTLLPEDSLTYQFNALANLGTPGNYLFKVWVALAGDTTQLNDTITTLVVHSVPNYCSSYAINGASGTDIGNITFSNLNNGTATPSQNNPTAINGYTDFTASGPAVQLAIGLSFPITVKRIVKGTTAAQAVVKVFIDYNRNGQYDVATETVMAALMGYNNYQASSTITIPSWVNPGVAQMRVVLQETSNQQLVSPCGAYPIGETEDYTVVLYPQIPYDGGVSMILAPTAIAPEASMQTVSVAIKNYGLDTLTSFTVSYEHNNNPVVTEPWTGTLLPGQSTFFSFNAKLLVLGGDNNVCAYTNVNGDSNFGNDPTCKYFYGDPQQDAKAVSLVDPSNSGCFVAHEPVTLKIQNVGLDTISGGLTASYYVVGQSTVVTETITATILPNAIYNYTFNQLVDLTAYTQDTLWEVVAYTTLVGDFENADDTARTTVESLYSPPSPQVTNQTINYATAATLTAISADSIYWFKTQNATQELTTGPTYTTPVLFGQEVYWVEAQADGGADAVTVGTGTTGQYYVPFYYFYDYSWSAMIYTAAELGIDGDIDTIAFYMNTTMAPVNQLQQKIYMGHTTLSTFPDGSYPSTAGMTQVYNANLNVTGPGWIKVPLSTPFDYNGTDNLLIVWENHDGDYSGNPSWQWAYTTTTGNRAKYKYQDNSFPATAGTLTTSRPNLYISGGGGGCPSPRIPDTVFIANVPPYDGALLQLMSPVSAPNLSAAEPVKVYIKNYGTQAITNFTVNYQINGGIIRTDTITTTLQQLDTLVYTFSQTANLEFYGSYQFKTWISVPGDITGINDTLFRTVKNQIPPYCPSYATTPSTYEDIGNVTISNLDNGNANPVISNPSATQGYTDWTNLPPVLLSPTVSYPISVKAISSSSINTGTTTVRVYIDWNRNGIFNVPAENVFTGTLNATNPVASGTVTLPVTATPGTTVMRVVMDRTGSASACGTYTYGETEDYLVMIIPMIPKDAGVTQILSPGTLGNAGDVVNVTVKIQNFGTQTLNNVPIAYEVNGGTPITYNYLFSLAPQATAVVNLPNHTLLEGNNRICAYTIVTDDSNQFNDSRCIDDYAQFTAGLPYCDNFDLPGALMWDDSLVNQWEWGSPGGTVINQAKSNPNVWATVLDGEYAHNGANFLYTPKFNHLITGLDSLTFWHRMNSNNGDGGAIQYLSILGWKLLGSHNDPKGHNWYNSQTGIWTGNGGSNNWIYSRYSLDNVNDMAEPTQFRFIFFTIQNNPGGYEGWAIDNLCLSVPIIPRDAGVVEILGPPSPTIIGTNIDVQVKVKNFGSDTLYSIPLKYKVNGATVNTGVWTGVLPPDSTTTYTFQPMPSPLTHFVLCAYTEVSQDINTYNNTTCDTFDVLPPNYDLTVNQIVSPITPTIHGDSATVSVWVKNQGLQPVSSFDMEYTVAGVVQASETWTGATPLQPNDSVLFTFNQKYKHSFIGFYYLCSKVTYPGDGYPWNDEKCGILEEFYTEVTESDLEGYAVGQNIPNPANGLTIIPFSLPGFGEYTFKVVNYLGQPVYSTQGEAGAGLHQISLDVSTLPAGLYFYTMEYQDRMLVRKMIIH